MFAAIALTAVATVSIDTGHSPSKAGAVAASGAAEYAYNRRQADSVSAWLRRGGVRVRRIGWETHGDSLPGRARAAAGTDLLISIHHDSVQPGTAPAAVRGFSLFVSGRNPRYAKSLRCALIIGQALVEAGHVPNAYHALDIPGEGHLLVDPARGVYRRDGLAVTSTGSVPTVLVEVGVIANPAEEAWLSRPEVADAIGATIAKGAMRCLQAAS